MSQGKRTFQAQRSFMLPDDIFEHIPKKHFYEQLDNLLDLDFIYDLTRPLYSNGIGRPSLDPVVFFKCMMVMFFEDILYFTELEYRLADSLTIRKFIGYKLDEKVPDESTIRKIFHRMPCQVFEAVFEHVLDVCNVNDLIKGKVISTDSTLLDANASMDSLTHRELGCSNRDFFMNLRRLEQERDDSDDQDSTSGAGIKKDKRNKKQSSLSANETWVSSTDPDARVMAKRDRCARMSYRADVSVDMDTGIVLSAGAETADTVDHTDFLLRVDEAVAALSNLGYEPDICVADSGHLNGPNLLGLEERGIESIITSPAENYRWSPGFARDDFSYDDSRDILICPEGQVLTAKHRESTYRVYRCQGSICRMCRSFGTCTRNKQGRSVRISDYQSQYKKNAERADSETGRALRWLRMQRGEAPFSFFKCFGGLRRLSCRGLDYAHKKVMLGAACFNLIRVIRAIIGNMHAKTVQKTLLSNALSILYWFMNLFTTNSLRYRLCLSF